MIETTVFIAQKGKTEISGYQVRKLDVRAILVKDDSDNHWIPTFLENNGIVLGVDETFRTTLGLHQPEQIKSQLDELYSMLSADPQKKEALEWLLTKTFVCGFELGNNEGRDGLRV